MPKDRKEGSRAVGVIAHVCQDLSLAWCRERDARSSSRRLAFFLSHGSEPGADSLSFVDCHSRTRTTYYRTYVPLPVFLGCMQPK